MTGLAAICRIAFFNPIIILLFCSSGSVPLSAASTVSPSSKILSPNGERFTRTTEQFSSQMTIQMTSSPSYQGAPGAMSMSYSSQPNGGPKHTLPHSRSSLTETSATDLLKDCVQWVEKRRASTLLVRCNPLIGSQDSL